MTASAAYVYAIVVDGVVRYIGKGRGRRLKKHLSVARRLLTGDARGAQVVQRRLSKALSLGASVEERVLVSGLSDADAYDRERAEIASFPNGQLWNLTDGGAGISSQDAIRRWSDPEYRVKQIAAANTPTAKRLKSESVRNAQRDPQVRKRVKAGQVAAFATPESKAKLTARNRRFWKSADYRAKVVAGRKAQWTPEARAKQSLTHKKLWTPKRKRAHGDAFRARWSDPAARAKLLAGRKKKAA